MAFPNILRTISVLAIALVIMVVVGSAATTKLSRHYISKNEVSRLICILISTSYLFVVYSYLPLLQFGVIKFIVRMKARACRRATPFPGASTPHVSSLEHLCPLCTRPVARRKSYKRTIPIITTFKASLGSTSVFSRWSKRIPWVLSVKSWRHSTSVPDLNDLLRSNNIFMTRRINLKGARSKLSSKRLVFTRVALDYRLRKPGSDHVGSRQCLTTPGWKASSKHRKKWISEMAVTIFLGGLTSWTTSSKERSCIAPTILG